MNKNIVLAVARRDLRSWFGNPANYLFIILFVGASCWVMMWPQAFFQNNLANLDTPGYRTKDLDFQFEYMSLQHGASPNVIEAEGLTVRNDGNNVSLDREARLLAENAPSLSGSSGDLARRRPL